MASTQAGESSASPPTDLPVHPRNKPEYDRAECIAAIKGEKVPSDLTSFWHRRAVVRGIRTSLEFATCPAVVELCSGNDSQAHLFSRARNARLIMSDIVPEMQDPATQPYCIWYPKAASEETYRELARRYPSMRYQVGRACAAAEYTDLYKDLDLLPDVSIAEESRHAAEDADIYQIFMAAPLRYAVMDDFTRSVNLENPQMPAFLNGNIKHRRALDRRVLPPKNLVDTTADDIDIEEDGFMGLKDTTRKVHHELDFGPGDSEHLWMPLPPDLPNIDKRLPTQLAAWEGNVDRYARLMHPRRLRTETEYDFGSQPSANHSPRELRSDGNERECREIRTAINARRIMNNDICGLDDDSGCLPWLIWWPVRPAENTLRELASKCPSMRPQIAITAILCDYLSLFRELRPPPRESFFEAAKQSRNPYYLKYLEEFVRERSIERDQISEYESDNTTVKVSLRPDLEPRDEHAHSSVRYTDMEIPYSNPNRCEWGDPGIFGGDPAYSGKVETYMWLSTEMAQKIQASDTSFQYGSSDRDWLLIDDDADSDDELYVKLNRPLKRMTSFEMKNWNDDSLWSFANMDGTF